VATDLLVTLEDRPGTLADLGEALGNAGINIEGFCAITSEGKGIVHLLVEDVAGARQALQAAGIKVEGETDVIVGDTAPDDVDRPGAMGAIARKIADAGINVTLVYLATNSRSVVATSDNAKAQQVLQS
jgi:hypothetical protein